MCERPDMIAKRTEVVGDCWIWQLALDKDGYGRKVAGGRKVMAHRWAYEMSRGPIPEGLQIDHLCRNRACVNPDHLEPVTCRENLSRGSTKYAENLGKRRCPQGHPLTGDNLYSDSRGWRGCKKCRRTAAQRYRAKRRA